MSKEKLDLNFKNIRDERAKLLAEDISNGRFPSLIELNLAGNKISEKGGIPLAVSIGFQLKNLIRLDMSNNLIGDNIIKSLSDRGALIYLEALNLANTGLTEKSIYDLTNAMNQFKFPSLENLFLARNQLNPNSNEYSKSIDYFFNNCLELKNINSFDFSSYTVGSATPILLAIYKDKMPKLKGFNCKNDILLNNPGMAKVLDHKENKLGSVYSNIYKL